MQRVETLTPEIAGKVAGNINLLSSKGGLPRDNAVKLCQSIYKKWPTKRGSTWYRA